MALFNDDTKIEDPTDLQVEDKNYLTELVGEGKKFKTEQDLAKGKVQSDAFIEQLKNELKVARTAAEKLQDELKTRSTLQEFVDQMKTNANPSPPPAKQPLLEGGDDVSKLTPDTIKQLVEQTIANKSIAQRETENLEFVRSKLVETFGQRYETKLRERTKELGMTEDEMTRLATQTPKAFLTLVNPTQPQTQGLYSPASSVNTEGFRTTGTSKTWAYYEKIRRENPRLYFAPSTHNEMMEQATALGDDFYK